MTDQSTTERIAELISVSDRLPECTIECTSSGTEISNTLLLYGKCEAGFNSHGLGHLQDDGKWICYETEYDAMNIVEVTHWMKLPRPKAAPASHHKEDKA